MASLASTYKELARISSRHLRRNGPSRGFVAPLESFARKVRYANPSTVTGFHASSRALAAQNFTMPAMSPTMTEGNIASWKVKEGEHGSSWASGQ